MADLEGNVQSYMHIGQHGGCSRWFTTFTKPANLEDADVQDLKKELESKPYNYKFKVAKRVNHDRYMQEYWKSRKEYFTPLKTENGQNLKNGDINKNLLFLQDEITLLVAGD